MLGALNPGLGLALLRWTIGVIFVVHGGAKVMGGISATTAFWSELGLPAPTAVAWSITLVELIAGLLLIVGYMISLACVVLILQKTIGLFLVHLPQGFFVVGPGQGGVEFNLLLIASLFTILLVGPGFGTLQARLQKDIIVL